jgi:hypothetical protein
MATGLDGLLFTLTTTLIVARILAFPTQIDLPDNAVFVYIIHVVTIYGIDAVANEIDVVLKFFDSGMKIQDFN